MSLHSHLLKIGMCALSVYIKNTRAPSWKEVVIHQHPAQPLPEVALHAEDEHLQLVPS